MRSRFGVIAGIVLVTVLAACGAEPAKKDEDKAKARQNQEQPSIIDQELKKQVQMYKEIKRYERMQQQKLEQAEK